MSDLRLSKREIEALRLLSDGLSDADTERRLIMTPRTARYHVASILHKLRAGNRTQAAIIALRRHLLDFDEPDLGDYVYANAESHRPVHLLGEGAAGG